MLLKTNIPQTWYLKTVKYEQEPYEAIISKSELET